MRTSAGALWAAARGQVDAGRPATGLRLATRALARQPHEKLSEAKSSSLRARILITMADALVELGRSAEASALLDEATALAPTALPAIQASWGVLFARTGRLGESQRHFDVAVQAFSAKAPSANQVRTLIWRGMLHLMQAHVPQARDDTAHARQIAAALGLTDGVAIATHNLGVVRWVAGDLPGALAAMATAEEMAPAVRAGIRSLDRARVLLAAGLLVEAHEYTQRAERIYAAERSKVDLADVLLVESEIELIARRPDIARTAARRAARSYAAAGHELGVLAARVMQARADALVRPRDAVGRRRAARHADDAERLAGDLIAAGLADDARTVRLLQAQLLLDVGAIDDAAAAADRAAALGASKGRTTQRLPSIASELQTSVVAARLEFARGRRSAAFRHIRRGLDELAGYQARFGSQDLQSASAVHGRELTVLGLRAALQTRSPATILQWLERSRAASTRLAAVRPPADPVLADELSRLRMASYRARAALLAGAPDPDLERQVDRLRRRVRSRSWTAGGSGLVGAPLPLATVQRALRDAGGDVSVVAPFRGNGRFHALVITGRSAHYRQLESDFGLEPLLQRMIGDLTVLADHRIAGPLRRVAVASLRTGLDAVSAAIVSPLEGLADSGPVIIAAAGSAAIVPWALLPGLSGRAVSVSPSVTAAVTGMGGRTPHRAGVLAVAGPEVLHGTREAEAVAGVYESDTATAVLTGSAATGGAVLGGIPTGGLLHIAAHGQHQPDNPLFSGVLLADGLLYGYDLAPNPALPAQVVLSSCDVGRTDDRPGSEPLGLVAALLRSGVRTVVAGTSKVSDEIAAAVMAGYHQRLRAGGRPATALAEAIVQLSDPRSDPAPFTCFGAGL